MKLFSTILIALTCLTGSCDGSQDRPNFVVFITDDQAFNGLSCTGNSVLRTPALDQLAASGVLFENAFVTTAICCCSRASILTGQHMRRHGIRDFARPLSSEQWQNTFPALLRAAGYRTAFLGKYAIGSPEVSKELSLPEKQFDLWFGFPQSISFKQMVDGRDRYLTTIMEEKASQFLADTQNSKAPFCLIVAIKEPHGPLDYFDPEFADAYATSVIPIPANLTLQSFAALPERVRDGLNGRPEWLENPAIFQAHMREKYAYISRADLAVGRICQALKDQGLEENTVVLHTSDNGSLEGAHGLAGKWVMYEESIHVPLIIRDPRLPADKRGRRSQMVLGIDIAPTILAMANVTAPKGMQGENLQRLLKDPKAQWREDWYYEHDFTLPSPSKQIPKSEGIRTERLKYIRFTDPQSPLEQLFDLVADPHEEHDLANDPTQARTLEKLRDRCDEYKETLR
jgi:arylsulfatase A-like enzyme